MSINTNGVTTNPKKGRKGVKTEVPKEVLPPYEANIPEPTTREELIKYWFPISLDDKTAQKLLWISSDRSKVSRMQEHACPVLERPERFEFSPQVLCKEGLQGHRGYWEVEYTGWVVMGVVYANSGRKVKDGMCGLGENEISWALGWSGSHYQAWHAGEIFDIDGKRGNILGLYVDQPAGVVAFYVVEGEQKEASLLHRFQTQFTDKLLPGFWVGYNSSCCIRNKD